MSNPHVFHAQLVKDDQSEATSIRIPFDVQAVFGARGRVQVCGTLNGIEFQGSLFPYAGVHYLGVNKQLRERAGLQAGDEVEVRLERDDAPREVTVPVDLCSALEANPGALDAWNELSFSRRKTLVAVVEEPKKPETRARRVKKVISEILAWAAGRAGKEE